MTTPGTPMRPPQPATISRRLAALLVDWLVAVAISMGFFNDDPMVTLVVFYAMTVILLATLGSTIGQLLLGLAVRDLGGALPGLGQAAIRTLALCIVIPAVVWGADGRGLHDHWGRTQIVRLR